MDSKTPISPHRNDLRPDPQCRAEAIEYLVQLLGTCPDSFCWDATHHLQGHAHAGRCDLVVIAPRDKAHRTIVLTEDDWDAVRFAAADQRAELLRTCVIDSHDRLEALLAAS